MQALYELMLMAERLSPRAQYCLDPKKDDLTPYFTHNHEVELYNSLLLKAFAYYSHCASSFCFYIKC